MSAISKLAKARRLVEPVHKSQTADTGKYTYTYASLGAVMASVDAACEQVGLDWWQYIEYIEGGAWQIITMLYDDDEPDAQGFGGPINTTKSDPQANGSALTYARRYALVTLFGLNQADDDGGMAARAANKPTERTPAEIEIRRIIAELPDAMAREDFQSDFVAMWGSGLSQLSESFHGEALGWTKDWVKNHTPAGKS